MMPIVNQTINGYTFHWADHGISIITDRLQVHRSDGHVSGEIYVQAVNGDGNIITIYPPTSYNFSADRTRRELSRSLTTKNPNLPWSSIIEQLCFGVQDRARKGEPVLELTTTGDIKPPEYILEPLIVKNYPNILFGDPSSAKSLIANVIAQVILLPWHDNPLGMIAPEYSVKVLYLDWEADPDTIRWQTTMLQRGIENIQVLCLNYRHCTQPLANDLEQIKLHIADTKTELIIIDSLGLAAGGELKETQSPLNFYEALRELKTTSLILAHNSKDRDAKIRTIYGNQYFTAQARNIWEVRKTQEFDSSELDIALFHRKPPPFYGMHKPMGFRIIFDNENGKMNIKQSNPKTVGEFLEQMGLKEQILETLKQGAMSIKTLANTLEKSETQVKSRCYELKSKGKLTKMRDTWGLVYNDS